MTLGYCLVVTIVLSANVQRSHQLQGVTNYECLSNVNMWKTYSKHFTFANTVTVKILSIINYREHDINDAATAILRRISSFTPLKTTAIQKCRIHENTYIENKNKPLEIQRNRTHYMFPLSNKYKILRSCSDPEDAYLIVAWNEEVIYQYLQEKPSFVFPKSRALYVVLLVFERPNSGIDEKIGNMLRMAWAKFNILNIIVQAPCSCNWNEIYIYRHFKKLRKSRGLVQINKIEEVLANEYIIINQLRSMEQAPLNISLFKREPTAMLVVPKGIANYSIYKSAKNITGKLKFQNLESNSLGILLYSLIHLRMSTIGIFDSTTLDESLTNVTIFSQFSRFQWCAFLSKPCILDKFLFCQKSVP